MGVLAPCPGMRILDLGCGDGLLMKQMVDAGAEVVGLDIDVGFVEAARALGLDARCGDGAAMSFKEEFDCVFSNATLHWMKADPDGVLRAVCSALRPGGRFVAEFGGLGNVRTIVAALSAELQSRGLDPEARNPWFFPGVEQYGAMLREAGLEVLSCELVPQPTHLESDISSWLSTFCRSWLRGMAQAEAEALLASVRDALAPELHRDAGWFIDYVRIRVEARKPAHDEFAAT